VHWLEEVLRGRGRGFESCRPHSREFCAKNAATCDKKTLTCIAANFALAGGGLPRLKKILIFSGFFGSNFIECQTLECPTKNTRQRRLCRLFFYRVIFAKCYTRQSLCRVQLGLCRVPQPRHSSKRPIPVVHRMPSISTAPHQPPHPYRKRRRKTHPASPPSARPHITPSARIEEEEKHSSAPPPHAR
jgi:hypothetical protein